MAYNSLVVPCVYKVMFCSWGYCFFGVSRHVAINVILTWRPNVATPNVIRKKSDKKNSYKILRHPTVERILT